MNPPPGWLDQRTFEHELERLGCAPGERRLEDWRHEGLLRPPPKQIATQGSGSAVWHAPTTPRQVLAIERVLKSKRDFKFAGAILWAAGFEVDEKYWRPELEKAECLISKFIPLIRRLVVQAGRRDSAKTLGDAASENPEFARRLNGIVRRLPGGEFARFVEIGAQALSGDEDALADAHHNDDELLNADLILKGLAADQGANHQVFGQKIQFKAGLAEIGPALISAFSQIKYAELSDAEIAAARDDVRNGFAAATCLYEAKRWIFGDGAFGLRFAANYPRKSKLLELYCWFLLLARVRRHAGQTLLPGAEINHMARVSEAAWLISNYFQELQQQDSEIRKFASAEAWKLRFSDSNYHGEMLEKLKGYNFPNPDFRPWNLWNSLAKKTTSPGLLVMSIGSFPHTSLAEVLANANAPTSP